ncbi:hypothetical protein ACJJTC_017548 [Scirpophaga incertulas]
MRSLLAYAEAVMAAAARGAGCALGCSGRGDCLNGTCLCEIRYAGDECAAPNLPYHACIGGVFLVVAFVCAVQLTICVASELPPSEGAHVPARVQGHHAEDALPYGIPRVANSRRLLRVAVSVPRGMGD